MSRKLPPRPDFVQLKHQAKDLLHAHERKDPAVQCDEGYSDAEDWPWQIGLIEPEDEPRDRHVVLMESLRLAIELATTERYGEYLSGFNAIEKWIEALADDERFGRLDASNWFRLAHANGYCYGTFWSARFAAEKYLRLMAQAYQPQVREQIEELACVYQRIHNALGRGRPEYACAFSLMPWRIGGVEKWTKAVRLAETEALREALALEREALHKCEALLPVLDAR
jgi:hypothetical protein